MRDDELVHGAPVVRPVTLLHTAIEQPFRRADAFDVVFLAVIEQGALDPVLLFFEFVVFSLEVGRQLRALVSYFYIDARQLLDRYGCIANGVLL